MVNFLLNKIVLLAGEAEKAILKENKKIFNQDPCRT